MSSRGRPVKERAVDQPKAEALVLVTQQGAVRTLALNRPKALNSFTGPMHAQLAAALDAAAADVSVRCLVLTGSGRGFCAGQDLSDPAVAPDLSENGQMPDISVVLDTVYRPLLRRLRRFPVPVIAAVNGVAAGAGASVALSCDLVVATRSASFIQAFSKIGLIPDAGGTWVLPRLVGRARALGLAMLGDKLSADEAERIGLIWQAVDDAAFTDAVQALGDRLAAMPAAALVATRRAMDAAQHLDLDAAMAAEAQTQSRLGLAADYREGVSAFYAKRAPVFTDRGSVVED
jgi:2-(1,2-epoxy-1,2-dihydrophenyl)acetyl-CoA isomerase